MEGCIFCEIISGKVKSYKVYENDWVLCVLDIHPVNMGHCLLMPKDHYKDMFDMDEDTYFEIREAIKNVVKIMEENLNAVRIKVIHSSGEGDNDERFHFHIHLIPHYEGENVDYLARDRYTEKDFQKIADKININC